MIMALFTAVAQGYHAVEVSGHSEYADKGNDIVCAAVTSCVEFTANTLTDVMNVAADIRVLENCVCISLKDAQNAEIGQQMLMGLFQHLSQLSAQYPRNIRVVVQRDA